MYTCLYANMFSKAYSDSWTSNYQTMTIFNCLVIYWQSIYQVMRSQYHFSLALCMSMLILCLLTTQFNYMYTSLETGQWFAGQERNTRRSATQSFDCCKGLFNSVPCPAHRPDPGTGFPLLGHQPAFVGEAGEVWGSLGCHAGLPEEGGQVCGVAGGRREETGSPQTDKETDWKYPNWTREFLCEWTTCTCTCTCTCSSLT